jgi:hypothetical protein
MQITLVLLIISLMTLAHADPYDPTNPNSEKSSPVTIPIKPAEVAPKKEKNFDARKAKKFHLALGLGYQLAGEKAKFDRTQYSDGVGGEISGEAELEFRRTYSFVIDGRILPIDSWGIIAGLNHEGERELIGGQITWGGVVYPVYTGDRAPKLQFTTAFLAATYRWKQFYLPFGFNYSSVKLSVPDGYNGSSTVTGAMGAQIGVGFMSTDHIAVELYGWVTNMNWKDKLGIEVVDYGSGTFQSLLLVAKYIF